MERSLDTSKTKWGSKSRPPLTGDKSSRQRSKTHGNLDGVSNTVRLDLKIEYVLPSGHVPITVPKQIGQSTPKSFFTKVAGISYRQDVAEHCFAGERLVLVREPNNPKDAGAIKILRENGEHLGYIPAHVSRHGDRSGLSYGMDQGNKYLCRVKEVTGGFGRTLGVNIEITNGPAFEEISLSKSTPHSSCASPPRIKVSPSRAPSNYSWLIVTGIVVFVFIIVLIARGS